jgi:hypothetical protein
LTLNRLAQFHQHTPSFGWVDEGHAAAMGTVPGRRVDHANAFID